MNQFIKYLLILLLSITSCDNQNVYESYSKKEYEKKVQPNDTSYQNINIKIGDIIYTIDNEMIVGEKSIVEMTLSFDMDIKKIIKNVKTFQNKNLHNEKIRMSHVMISKLIDPSGNNFIIVPITSERQLIEKNNYTLWKWYITPLVKGENELILTVDIIIHDNQKTIEVFNGYINVISNDTIITNIIKFLGNNWKWLLSTLLIPLIIFFYKKEKRN
jgi:hypothetical protein